MIKNLNISNSFFLLKNTETPNIGFTTGTCAAAASVAATRMFFSGEIVPYVILTTPKGLKVFIEIENQVVEKDFSSCSVQKIAGTDPDVTDGIKIFAKVSKIVTNFQRKIENSPLHFGRGDSAFCHFERSGSGVEKSFTQIEIEGGEGIGRVTLPGLDQKPGNSAINSVPRKMIFEGVKREIEKAGAGFGVKIEISAPGGEEIAKKTFNPKLGIIGGISILGTSGIVEPMSEQAILDTIRLEINVRKSQDFRILPIVPGNYGADFLSSEFGFSPEIAVHCSNFIYDSLKMASEAGFRKILFCGHIGKLVKVAGGVKNTHSKFGDRRMEILSEVTQNFVLKEHFSSIKEKILHCVSSEAAIEILDSLDENHEIRNKIMAEIVRRIQNRMISWLAGKVQIEVVIFTKEKGLLAETKQAKDFFKDGFSF